MTIPFTYCVIKKLNKWKKNCFGCKKISEKMFHYNNSLIIIYDTLEIKKIK